MPRPGREGPTGDTARSYGFFNEVKVKSQDAFALFTTPATSFDSTMGCVSHSHGIAGASPVICLSIWPHTLARWAGSWSTSARAMALLTPALFSSGQLELFTGMIAFPLNVRSSRVSGSGKSLSHPTLGQIWGSFLGTLQKFVYMVSRVTARNVILNPSFSNCACATWAAFCCWVALSATMSSFWLPVYFPLG